MQTNALQVNTNKTVSLVSLGESKVENTIPKTANVADWTYENAENSINLTGYKGTATDIVIPNGNDFYNYDAKTYSGDYTVNITADVLKEATTNATSIATSQTAKGNDQYNHGQIIKASDSNWNSVFYKNQTLKTIDLSNLDTSSVTDMHEMFENATNLTTITGLDNWDVSHVTDFSGMFEGDTSLTSLGDLSKQNTSSATDMNSMFENCTKLITTGKLNNWDVHNVSSFVGMFNNTTNVTDIGDLSNWNTSSATDLHGMFMGTKGLSDIGDLSNWQTGSLMNITNLFNGSNLTNVGSLKNWNTSRLTLCENAFAFSKIKQLDLSNWNVHSATNMSQMFYGAGNLTSVGDLSNWDVSNVDSMNGIFKGDWQIKDLGDLSKWHIKTDVNLAEAFYNCSSLQQLNISNWPLKMTSGSMVHGMVYNVPIIIAKNMELSADQYAILLSDTEDTPNTNSLLFTDSAEAVNNIAKYDNLLHDISYQIYDPNGTSQTVKRSQLLLIKDDETPLAAIKRANQEIIDDYNINHKDQVLTLSPEVDQNSISALARASFVAKNKQINVITNFTDSNTGKILKTVNNTITYGNSLTLSEADLPEGYSILHSDLDKLTLKYDASIDNTNSTYTYTVGLVPTKRNLSLNVSETYNFQYADENIPKPDNDLYVIDQAKKGQKYADSFTINFKVNYVATYDTDTDKTTFSDVTVDYGDKLPDHIDSITCQNGELDVSTSYLASLNNLKWCAGVAIADTYKNTSMYKYDGYQSKIIDFNKPGDGYTYKADYNDNIFSYYYKVPTQVTVQAKDFDDSNKVVSLQPITAVYYYDSPITVDTSKLQLQDNYALKKADRTLTLTPIDDNNNLTVSTGSPSYTGVTNEMVFLYTVTLNAYQLKRNLSYTANEAYNFQYADENSPKPDNDLYIVDQAKKGQKYADSFTVNFKINYLATYDPDTDTTSFSDFVIDYGDKLPDHVDSITYQDGNIVTSTLQYTKSLNNSKWRAGSVIRKYHFDNYNDSIYRVSNQYRFGGYQDTISHTNQGGSGYLHNLDYHSDMTFYYYKKPIQVSIQANDVDDQNKIVSLQPIIATYYYDSPVTVNLSKLQLKDNYMLSEAHQNLVLTPNNDNTKVDSSFGHFLGDWHTNEDDINIGSLSIDADHKIATYTFETLPDNISNVAKTDLQSVARRTIVFHLPASYLANNPDAIQQILQEIDYSRSVNIDLVTNKLVKYGDWQIDKLIGATKTANGANFDAVKIPHVPGYKATIRKVNGIMAISFIALPQNMIPVINDAEKLVNTTKTMTVANNDSIDKTALLVVNKPNDLPAKLAPLAVNVPGIETTKDIENVALSKPIVELPLTVLSDLNLKQYKLLKRDGAKYFFKVKQDLLIVDLKQNNYQIKLLRDGKIITKKNFENYYDLIKYLQLHNFVSVNE